VTETRPRPGDTVPDTVPPAEHSAAPARTITGRIARLMAGNMAGRVGALASLGVATILVARIGGPALVGAFTLVRILPGLVCHLSNAGLPAAAPYFLAGRDGAGREYDQ
jgi:O-antigen/teichoic acid export membrane protein